MLYHETIASETTEQDYIYALDELQAISTITGTEETLNFYYSDVLGTTRFITNETGGIEQSNITTPFGLDLVNGVKDASDKLTYQYAGHGSMNEAIGLTYMNARWMDNNSGRFISLDPAGQGVNHYIYAGNNPTSMIDPTGLTYDYYFNDWMYYNSFLSSYNFYNSYDFGLDYLSYQNGGYFGNMAYDLGYYDFGFDTGYVRELNIASGWNRESYHYDSPIIDEKGWWGKTWDGIKSYAHDLYTGEKVAFGSYGDFGANSAFDIVSNVSNIENPWLRNAAKFAAPFANMVNGTYNHLNAGVYNTTMTTLYGLNEGMEFVDNALYDTIGMDSYDLTAGMQGMAPVDSAMAWQSFRALLTYGKNTSMAMLPLMSKVDDVARVAKTSSSKGLQTYYPANDGALGKIKNTYLKPGSRVDRFGSEWGQYLAPEGTPMPMRALPTNALEKTHHVYEVLKPIQAQQSVIAPAFNQIGLGTQYKVPVSVNVLVEKGFLRRIK